MALDFFAGCVGGCAGVLVGHPFDTIKVRLQTQDFKNPMYRGTLDCLTRTIKKESVLGLYKGMSSPMAGIAVVNAIVFGVYGNCQRRLSDPNALSSHFLAGAAAGLSQSFICSPMELVKTRLQLQQGGRVAYNGPLDCLVQVARTEGIRGVFKGLGITMIREVPGFGTYFFTYELMTRSTPMADGSPSPPISTPFMLLAGGLSGTVSWVITYPVDVIKSRLQADTTGRYQGMFDCLRKSVQTEGLGVLTRGLTSTILRAFPTNAATFTVVTWIFRWANMLQDNDSSAPYIVPEVAVPKVQINEVFLKSKEDTSVVFRMEYKGDYLRNVFQWRKIVLHDFLGHEMFDSSRVVGGTWTSTDEDSVLTVHEPKDADEVCEETEPLVACPQEEPNLTEDHLQNTPTPVNR